MSMPGIFELLIIFGVALLLFGSKKLPALGGAVGEAIKNFKKGMKNLEEDDEPKKIDGQSSKTEVVEVQKEKDTTQ